MRHRSGPWCPTRDRLTAIVITSLFAPISQMIGLQTERAQVYRSLALIRSENDRDVPDVGIRSTRSMAPPSVPRVRRDDETLIRRFQLQGACAGSAIWSSFTEWSNR